MRDVSLYLVVILGLVVAFTPASTPNLGFADPMVSILLTVLALCLAPMPTMFLAGWVRRRVYDNTLSRRRRMYGILRAVSSLFPLAVFAGVITLCGWGRLVDNFLSIDDLIPLRWMAWCPPLALGLLLDEAFRFLPFLVMLLMSWVPLYRVDVLVRRGHWSLADYVVFHLRQYVLFLLVPFFAMLLVENVWDVLPPALQEQLRGSWGLYALTGALIVLALICLPLLLRFVWKTRPLPDGLLRRRLEDLIARTHLRCRQILLWDTFGGQMINACVTGFVGITRYILMTDTLIKALEPDEIVAVFAHEIAHARRHHIAYYVMFAVGFAPMVALPEVTVAPGFIGAVFHLMWLVTALALYWGVVFGYLSRRMELEADLDATEVCGRVFDLVNALEKISQTGGKPRSAGSWRHFSIQRRVEFLIDTVGNPAAALALRRQVRLLKALCILIATVTVLLGVFFPGILKTLALA